MSRRAGGRLSLDGRLVWLSVIGTACGAVAAGLAAAAGAGPWLVASAAAATGVVATLLAVRSGLRGVRRVTQALRDGVDGFRGGDYTLRLATEGAGELAGLVEIYNAVAATLGEERRELRQRELLLSAMIEATPAAVLLVNEVGRVVLANRAARELLGGGRRLDGQVLAQLAEGLPGGLRRALVEGDESLVTVSTEGDDEAYSVGTRRFELNARRHLLLMVRRVTPELRRQEAAAWRRVLRVVGHEINNSLAPVRSLARSALRLVEAGDPDGRLPEVLATIDESAAGLHRFVDGYRRVARLPTPRREPVELRAFVARLVELEPCRVAGEVPARTVRVDPDQLQQVVLNLLRNAREAGSAAADTELAARLDDDGALVLAVADRGRGMDDTVLGAALSPFFTTKADGGGLGLALCREIVEAHGGGLEISRRRGGGVRVTCTIPLPGD